MKVSELGPYYEWAENRIIKLLAPLPDDQFEMKLENTGVSLRDLTIHMIIQYEWFFHWSEKTFMKEMRDKLSRNTKEELLKHWRDGRNKFLAAIKEEDPNKTIEVPFTNDKIIKIRNEDYLFAYTDHHTYHRGQIVTTFKAVTGNEAVNTDYYTYLAEVKKK